MDFIHNKTLDSNTFLNFKRYLKDRTDLGISSKNKYLITARIFLKELNRTQLLPSDITHNVKCFNQGRKHKKTGVTQNEVTTLCQSIKQLSDTNENLRLKAILSLLIFQGLRQKEIIGLNIEHINLNNSTAQITGKGRDDHESIHLHPETVASLNNYLSSINLQSGALFTNLSNNAKSPNERISTKSIRTIIKKLLTDNNIQNSTHGFRHYFTTSLLQSFNGNILAVSELTRHKSLDMLTVYNDSRISTQNLSSYYNSFQDASLR